ncbi:uncharacterized protein LOC128228456 isoform X2 [Mya arenaria]|uniref:uncharacterized protein LOC128228456 isoform X2 n=1 Tax=Mya arenaria TaxID=6604 RepID=UPI0022E208AE|nr:uncharacterized protein LOC128228456 isoform X2 [Mya arenaria]
MWDCRHVGFIYFVMYLNRFYSSLSLACNVDSNGFHRFGPNCEHLCHYVRNQRCDDVTGECDECEVPWFGPACQYSHFNGYKVYIENLTSWGYEDDDRNYIPRNTSRSLCYQHDGSEITNRTMVVQCVKTLIGNSVRIEMANKYSQLVLCDIKISAGRNIAFGKGLTLSPNSIDGPYSPTGAVYGNTNNTHVRACSGMFGNDTKPKWIQVDLMQKIDLNLIVITAYQTDGFLDSGVRIEVSIDSTSLFKEVFDN